MDYNTFNDIVEDQIGRTRSVLISKQAEYAHAGDRLHNFRSAAAMQGVSLQEALGGMMIKHTVSIYDMINSSKTFTEAEWNEKITDHVNYLILLRAIVEESLPGDPTTAVLPATDFQSNVRFKGFAEETPVDAELV